MDGLEEPAALAAVLVGAPIVADLPVAGQLLAAALSPDTGELLHRQVVRPAIPTAGGAAEPQWEFVIQEAQRVRLAAAALLEPLGRQVEQRSAS